MLHYNTRNMHKSLYGYQEGDGDCSLHSRPSCCVDAPPVVTSDTATVVAAATTPAAAASHVSQSVEERPGFLHSFAQQGSLFHRLGWSITYSTQL